jgi:hypothetical protein
MVDLGDLEKENAVLMEYWFPAQDKDGEGRSITIPRTETICPVGFAGVVLDARYANKYLKYFRLLGAQLESLRCGTLPLTIDSDYDPREGGRLVETVFTAYDSDLENKRGLFYFREERTVLGGIICHLRYAGPMNGIGLAAANWRKELNPRSHEAVEGAIRAANEEIVRRAETRAA